MPRTKGSPKTGGRVAGTPNKSTRAFKSYLDRIFTRAFTESHDDATLEDRLVKAIVTMSLDPKLLTTYLAYWAGTPTKQIDVAHSGTVSLAALIAGTVDTTALPGGEDEDEPALEEGDAVGHPIGF